MSVSILCARCHQQFPLNKALFDDWMDARRSLICPFCEAYLRYKSVSGNVVFNWKKILHRAVIIFLILVVILSLSLILSEEMTLTLLAGLMVFVVIRYGYFSSKPLVATEIILPEEIAEDRVYSVYDNEI